MHASSSIQHLCNYKTLLNLLYVHVVVSADKAPNNHVFVCKSHYIDCLETELSLDNLLCTPYIYLDYPFGIFSIKFVIWSIPRDTVMFSFCINGSSCISRPRVLSAVIVFSVSKNYGCWVGRVVLLSISTV